MLSGRVLSLCSASLSLFASACSGSTTSVPVEQQPPGQPPPPVSQLSPQSLAPGARPPAISGGTLLVQSDGTTAVAADPDRDVIWIVDLTTAKVLRHVQLQPGDEPGRVAEDSAGGVQGALRRGGALVSIDPKTGTVLARRAVCPAPRGLAYDLAQDALHVACADGLLATFPAAGGAATRALHVDGDLRDVVVQDGTLYVSRFRSAELLQLAADGTIAQRTTLPPAQGMAPMGPTTAAPSVAYRTVAFPGGGVVMLHQRAQVEAVDTTPGGYAGFGMCPGAGIVHDAVSFIQPAMPPSVATALAMTTLAVDIAVSPDGSQIGVAAPGNAFGPTVSTYPTGLLQVPMGGPGPCSPPPGGGPGASGDQFIAVAFDGQQRLVAQSREPASISVAGISIALPAPSVYDDAHMVFHTGTKAGIACASCHPEGGDDGRVWQFTGLGARRTQNLQGGVMARMPFHWSGDIPNMNDLVTVVLMGRMVGPQISDARAADLGAWMNAQPALAAPPPADATAVTRGAALFTDASTGCTGCHSGPQLSTHALVDVGTGGTFKVPSLIGVGYRAPYLHDGCAATLLDRFGATCGGGEQHGHTAQLGANQLSDLVAFLQSL